MKKENTSIRLKQIMDNRNLKQVDILDMTKPYCVKYDVNMCPARLSRTKRNYLYLQKR